MSNLTNFLLIMFFALLTGFNMNNDGTYKLNTELCAEYNDGYVYYYHNDANQSVLTRINLTSNIEEKLAATNKISDIRIYNDSVYYIGENI